MKPFTEKQKQRWEKSQKMGKVKYSIVYGLFYGGFVATITPFIYNLISGFSVSSTETLYRDFSLLGCLLRYPWFMLIGILVYRYTWNSNQKRYNKTIELQANNI